MPELRGPAYLLKNPFKFPPIDESIDYGAHLPFQIFHEKFREGLAAFVSGGNYDNPYSISQYRQAWRKGWLMGYRKYGEH